MSRACSAQSQSAVSPLPRVRYRTPQVASSSPRMRLVLVSRSGSQARQPGKGQRYRNPHFSTASCESGKPLSSSSSLVALASSRHPDRQRGAMPLRLRSAQPPPGFVPRYVAEPTQSVLLSAAAHCRRPLPRGLAAADGDLAAGVTRLRGHLPTAPPVPRPEPAVGGWVVANPLPWSTGYRLADISSCQTASGVVRIIGRRSAGFHRCPKRVRHVLCAAVGPIPTRGEEDPHLAYLGATHDRVPAREPSGGRSGSRGRILRRLSARTRLFTCW